MSARPLLPDPLPTPEEALAAMRERATETWKRKFLEALLDTEGDVTESAKLAGVKRIQAYSSKERDKAFARRWERTMHVVEQLRSDRIEMSATERAVNGTPYTKYDKDGNVVEEGSTPSPNDAALLLKAYRPEKFKRKELEAPRGTEYESLADLVRAFAERDRARASLEPVSRPALLAADPAIEAELVSDTPAPLHVRVQ